MTIQVTSRAYLFSLLCLCDTHFLKTILGLRKWCKGEPGILFIAVCPDECCPWLLLSSSMFEHWWFCLLKVEPCRYWLLNTRRRKSREEKSVGHVTPAGLRAVLPQVHGVFDIFCQIFGDGLFGRSQGSMICINQGCKNMAISGIVKKKKKKSV